MKVIGYLVSQYPSPSHTFIRREVNELRRRGLEIHTYTIRRPDNPESLGAADFEEYGRTWSILPVSIPRALKALLWAFCRNPGAWLGALSLALRHRLAGIKNAAWSFFYFVESIVLAEDAARRGIERIHSHFSNSGGMVGLLAARYLGIPWSVTLHGKADFFSSTTPLLGGKINLADFVVCVSRNGKALAMLASRPEDWEKILLVRCGLDFGIFPTDVSPPSAPPVKILSVGRLSPEKGQLGLVDSVAELRARGLDVQCVILGEGPSRKTLENRIKRLGMEGTILLPGGAKEEDVFREMASSHLFALSSLFEGLPVVLMEAMAFGLPVVAPGIAGIPELVQDGRNGFLFAPGDWGGLAHGLEVLARDGELRRKFGSQGRKVVVELHDITRALDPLEGKFRGGTAGEGS